MRRATRSEAPEAGGLKILVEHRDRRVGDHVAGRSRPESRRSAGRSPAPRAEPGRTYRCGSETRKRPRSRRCKRALDPCGCRGRSRQDSAAQFLPGRPVAHHDLAARQVERQKGLDVLLHRQSSDGEKYRSRQPEIAAGARPEQIGVDAARPAHQLAKSAPHELLGERVGRRHGDRARHCETSATSSSSGSPVSAMRAAA